MDWKKSERGTSIRLLMENHVSKRLSNSLEKLGNKSDSKSKEKIKDANKKYVLDSILQDSTKVGKRIAIATHIAKAIHADLHVKKVSNILLPLDEIFQQKEVGSHNLAEYQNLADTTGDGAYNSKAYEIYLLLEIKFENLPLAYWLREKDPAAIAAFNGPESATNCLAILEPKTKLPASHTKSKQLYWLVGEDATDDTQYHLLAPLHPTSLVHVVYDTLQEARFGEANKAARAARKERKAHAGTLYDYPNLAIQKMGGTKPQNISQLNSERRGNNYLLASLPPQWQSSSTRQPWGIRSVFERMLIAREGVRHTLKTFLQFLRSNPPTNMDTRNRVEGYVSDLIDELVTLAGELQHGWPSGWSADSRCEMVRPEQLWLDPHRAGTDPDFRQEWLWMDWPAQIGHRFGNWLNTQLEGEFRVGDAELRQWKKELLLDESDDGWAHSLHRLRAQQDAPQYIAARQGVIA